MKQIYYEGTPNCERSGSCIRVFDNFMGQICKWKEDPIKKTLDIISINSLSDTEVYNIINDNNLLDQLSTEGLNKYYAYEMPPKRY